MSTELKHCYFCNDDNETSLWTLNNGRAIPIYAHERCVTTENFRRNDTQSKWRYMEYKPEMIGIEWRFCGHVVSTVKLNDGTISKNYCGSRARFELLYEKDGKHFRKPVCSTHRVVSRKIQVRTIKSEWAGNE